MRAVPNGGALGGARGCHAQLRPADAFQARRLEQVFADCFAAGWRTRLIGGAEEPYYQPAEGPGDVHLLSYRSDYFASALHEIAHWCIAGDRRRQLPDFGYWYTPDGRTAEQQRGFETVEAGPQALEWIFSLACGYRFCISLDNLGAPEGVMPDSGPFRQRVLSRARAWRRRGLPHRAGLFLRALAREFGTDLQLADLDLNAADLTA